jgi:hypothetical protein
MRRSFAPRAWVFYYGAVSPLYSIHRLWFQVAACADATDVFGCGDIRSVSDYRHLSAIIAGIPFEGSLVATVDEYNGTPRAMV